MEKWPQDYRRVISGLTKHQAKVFTLAFHEDMAPEDIARRLKVKRRAVECCIARICKKFKSAGLKEPRALWEKTRALPQHGLSEVMDDNTGSFGEAAPEKCGIFDKSSCHNDL